MEGYHIFCGYENDNHFEWYETADSKECAEMAMKVEGEEPEGITNRVILGEIIDIKKVLSEDIELSTSEDLNAYYLINIVKRKGYHSEYIFEEEDIYSSCDILTILKELDKRTLPNYMMLFGRDLDIIESPILCIQTFEINE